MVIADKAFTMNEEAEAIIHALSRAAVELNLSKVVTELGMTEHLGTSQFDPLADVPEVKPVLVTKVRFAWFPTLKSILIRSIKLQKKALEGMLDGKSKSLDLTEGQDESVTEVPFNLDILRKHLTNVQLARRVLPDDVTARQKLLEESVYDVAVERLKRQAELFEQLNLTDGVLNQSDLQHWMWNWHKRLRERLTRDITAVLAEEDRVPTGGMSVFVLPQSRFFINVFGFSETKRIHGRFQSSRPFLEPHQARETFSYRHPRGHASSVLWWNLRRYEDDSRSPLGRHGR